ncbi:monoterpene synthase 8, chloroplastic-like [Musa acuminata AAA Group]|uniref:monoterpene synthase 8, chloroplastic-like n=1 Tax=Musa acuminata AAA Group TaxID=214697 RepID=UPI0031E1A216
MTYMALLFGAPSFTGNLNILRRTTISERPSPRIRCSAQAAPTRRTANYQPNLWTADRIQSLTSSSATVEEERKTKGIDDLKEDVRKLIYEKKEVEDQLQLVDHLQQLGVAYHFKDDIDDVLRCLYGSLEDINMLLKDDLHATALVFRLLRENGFDVSEDLFNRFRDEKGDFKASLQHETKGILSLYEASYVAKEGELVLDQATDFTTKHLKCLMEKGSLEPRLREHVAHALELPLHWRMQRLHTRWFIEAYQREATMNPVVLELAKLDFNVVQGMYKGELRELSIWWTNLGLAQKLSFFRDRLTENFLWTVGCAFEPQFWEYREIQTKANCLIAMLDDVYDIYGTLNELELFTEAIERWDANKIDRLPDYMKLCFLAIFNAANETGYRVMKEKGLDIIPFLRKAWTDLCKAFLLEAKWYNQGHKPKLDEYLDNAWMSSGGHVFMTNAYCMSDNLTKESLESFSTYPKVARCSAMLFRLYNDLATSTIELERGDAPSSIQCYMLESGVPETAARKKIRELIKANWRGINGDRSSSYGEIFKTVAVGLPRMSQFIYQHGDGYSAPDGETKKQIVSLLFEPLQL